MWSYKIIWHTWHFSNFRSDEGARRSCDDGNGQGNNPNPIKVKVKLTRDCMDETCCYRRTVGQILPKCKETSKFVWFSMIWLISVLFVCWNLFSTIAKLRIKCVTKSKNVFILVYKNVESSFSTWLTHLTLRFLYIFGCSGPRCAAAAVALVLKVVSSYLALLTKGTQLASRVACWLPYLDLERDLWQQSTFLSLSCVGASHYCLLLLLLTRVAVKLHHNVTLPIEFVSGLLYAKRPIRHLPR